MPCDAPWLREETRRGKAGAPWRQGLPGRSGRWRNGISRSTPAAENAAARVTNEIYANTSSPSGRGGALQEIRRKDVIELVEGLVTDGTPTLANRVQSLISSVFTFAMDADLAEANPCHRLRKRGVERVGRRVLSDEEIRLFWSRIVEPPATRRTGLALRLTLLTGARISEIAGISRAELERLGDASRAAWIIPGTRTKNGRDHLVPLSPLARDLVLDLLETLVSRTSFYCPPTPGTGKAP